MVDILLIEQQMREYEVKHGKRPTVLRVSPKTFMEILKEVASHGGSSYTAVEKMKLLGAAIIRDPKIEDGIFEMSSPIY